MVRLALITLYLALISDVSARRRPRHRRRSACHNPNYQQPMGARPDGYGNNKGGGNDVYATPAAVPSPTQYNAADDGAGAGSGSTDDTVNDSGAAAPEPYPQEPSGSDAPAEEPIPSPTGSTAAGDDNYRIDDNFRVAGNVPPGNGQPDAGQPDPAQPPVTPTPAGGETPPTPPANPSKPGASSTFTNTWGGPAGRPSDWPDLPPIEVKEEGGLMSVGYITEWGVYNTTYDRYDHYTNSFDTPNSILGSTNMLTHAIFAFGCPDPSGTVKVKDIKVDEEAMTTDFGDWVDLDGAQPATDFKGSLGQLWQQKQVNRNLKVMLSIGGYNCSQDKPSPDVPDGPYPGFLAAITAAKDSPPGPAAVNFVESTMKFVNRWGLDGIDLDWEPDGLSAETYPDPGPLVKLLRDQLKRPALLSCTLGTLPDKSAGWRLETNAQYFDFYNLMAFDMYGANWEKTTYFQNHWDLTPNLDPPITVSAEKGYKTLLDINGIEASQINIGMPLYGQAWANVQKDPSKPIWSRVACGVGCTDTNFAPPYKILPVSKQDESVSQYHVDPSGYEYDPKLIAAYWYGTSKTLGENTFISYESPESAKAKVAKIIDAKLGGIMFWDMHADKDGKDSLVYQTAGELGGLLKAQNNLCFKDSPMADVKALATPENCQGSGETGETTT